MNDCKNLFLVLFLSCIVFACVSQNLRSGLCPIPTGPGICADYCNKDGDCPGAKKCCSNGCGNECMNPLPAPPSFQGTPSNTTVKETEDVLLTCYASSPDTKITWLKDGKTVTGGNFAFFRGRLLILRVKREDRGWYVCNATNREGTKVARAYLQVLPSLDAVRCPDPGAPKNGKRHPSPKKGSDYSQGSMIRYTCSPRFYLHGPVTRMCLGNGRWSDKAPECLAPPRFQQVPTNATVKVRASILLRCSVSTPDTNVTWFKDGKVVKGNKFAVVRNGLWIPSVYRDNQGWYVCKATNKGGTKVARAYLKVSGPLDTDCGRPTVTRNDRGRIVGGKKVGAGMYPWQVSLWNTRLDKHFCGGSLVAKRWVVTAASCVARISVQDIEVRLGKLYINKGERGKEQLILPDRIITHPHYVHNNSDYDRDVALIRLRESAVYTHYVRPICLPLQKANVQDADKFLLRPGNIGVITGWGSKRNGGRGLKRMHQVTVPIVDQATCKMSHKRYLVSRNMFCAGHFNGTLGDACQGDSGGPLAIKNSLTPSDDNVRWVLAGIISWGDGCGRIGKYGVYTRVPVFAQWINGQINAND